MRPQTYNYRNVELTQNKVDLKRYRGKNKMKNDARRDLKQKQANKQHMQDLQFRLDMVAGNAKSKRC